MNHKPAIQVNDKNYVGHDVPERGPCAEAVAAAKEFCCHNWVDKYSHQRIPELSNIIHRHFAPIIDTLNNLRIQNKALADACTKVESQCDAWRADAERLADSCRTLLEWVPSETTADQCARASSNLAAHRKLVEAMK